MNKQRGQTNKQTNKQRDFAYQGDLINRCGVYAWLCNMGHEHLADAIMDENRFPSAQPDLDSAYTEGYTAAESKYRAIFDEMQATIKAKAFGKRKGLIHTADIYAMLSEPTNHKVNAPEEFGERRSDE